MPTSAAGERQPAAGWGERPLWGHRRSLGSASGPQSDVPVTGLRPGRGTTSEFQSLAGRASENRTSRQRGGGVVYGHTHLQNQQLGLRSTHRVAPGTLVALVPRRAARTGVRALRSDQPSLPASHRPGVTVLMKVDPGAKPLAGAPGETVTEGLDRLRERLMEYRHMSARCRTRHVTPGRGSTTTFKWASGCFTIGPSA